MRKILVIGCPGAGKSTFARFLGERTGLPVCHLDLLWHRPDRTNVPREEFDAALDAVLATDGWIIDGHYGRTLPRRLEACDTVFLLDFPVEVCLQGVADRVGKPRTDMPWVEQEPDPEFVEYIRQFPENHLKPVYELLKQCEDKQIVIFSTRQELEKYKEELL